MPPLGIGGSLIQLPAASSVPAFNANSFSNCLFWYDPTDNGTITTYGGYEGYPSVTAVSDKGPNSLSATAPNGGVAVRNTAIDGQQTFRVDTVGYLSATLPSTARLHFFTVFMLDGTSQAYQDLLYLNGQNTQTYVHVNTALGFLANGASQNDAVLSATFNNVPVLVDYAIDTVAGSALVTLSASGTGATSASTAFTAGTNLSGAFVLGYHSSADFGDFVAYSAIKTGTDLASIRSQLRAKWGI